MPVPLRKFDNLLLDSAISNSNAILQGEYPILNGTTLIKYTCKCSKNFEKKFKNIIYYGGAYCNECVNKNKANKIKNTCKIKYGVDNPSQLQEIKDKKNESYTKHFGCHPLQSKEIQEKREILHFEKYGCKNPSQRFEVKEKIKKVFDEKYSGHPMHNHEVKNKIREKWFEKYGGHPMHNDEVKNKIRETCLEKYGGHPMLNDKIKDKVKESCLEKYGCFPSQTPEIFEKAQINAKKYKKYTLPSGKIINIQGYEHFALNLLLETYNEEQIITERKHIPRIKYSINDKTKYYFPDIFIPSENKIIEVKSSWTYRKDIIINKLKWQATKDAGYTFEVWIFDKNGQQI